MSPRLHDPAALIEQFFAFVGDDHFDVGAAFDVILDLVGQPMHVDDGPLDAGLDETVEHMVDQRTPRDLDHGFGRRQGQRPHARAEAGGEDHGGPGGEWSAGGGGVRRHGVRGSCLIFKGRAPPSP